METTGVAARGLLLLPPLKRLDRLEASEDDLCECCERSERGMGRCVLSVPSMERETRSLGGAEPSIRRRLPWVACVASLMVSLMFLVCSLRPKKLRRGRRLLIVAWFGGGRFQIFR